MSFSPQPDPKAGDSISCDAIETLVVPRSVDLGDEFYVRRVLPHASRRTVGPFVFFDHMGPAVFKAGHGIDVRPHPHIGLSTLTYLYDGEIMHRDTLGMTAAIRPGEVNWMTAGRGIVHSERTAPERRVQGEPLHGLQLWVGMPSKDEEIDPGFIHHDDDDLPVVDGEGKHARIIAGSLFGAISPLRTTSETLFADVSLEAGAAMPFDPTFEERAIYVESGEIDIGGDRFLGGRLVVLRPGDAITVRAVKPSRVALVGGAPLDGPRYVWWNFVSSRRERIEQAKADWCAGHFGKIRGDEIEFIPLPEDRPLPPAVDTRDVERNAPL